MLGIPYKTRALRQAPYLVTGAAGFIGAAVSRALLDRGRRVTGVDNFTPYYDPALKHARAAHLTCRADFRLLHRDLADPRAVAALFEEHRPQIVIHLAAQPGVAHSTTAPLAYVHSNVVATMNVMEACRVGEVEHLVYASSSSVYGAGSALPLSTDDPAGHPLSVYAATKRAGELMAHSYSHLFGLPTTGLRFFTVYGPWGRPDMAYYSFAQRLVRGEPITIYGDGEQSRDFTYIDDVVDAVVELAEQPPKPGPGSGGQLDRPTTAPYRLLNVGRGEPVSLSKLICLLEQGFGMRAITRYEEPRAADLHRTQAQIDDLQRAVGFTPGISVEAGIARFIDWFRRYDGGQSRSMRPGA